MTSKITWAAKRGFGLLACLFMVAMLVPQEGIAESSGYWAFKGREVNAPPEFWVKKGHSIHYDQQDSGLSSRCSHVNVKRETVVDAGHLSWSLDFSQQRLQPGQQVRVRLALERLAGNGQSWTGTIKVGQATLAYVTYSDPRVPSTMEAVGTIPGKLQDLRTGVVNPLVISFGLGSGNEVCSPELKWIYEWKEGAPPPPKEPAEAKAKPIGCYKDDAWNRDLAGYTFSEPGMTTQKCTSACQHKGFGYAATQFSTHCFCANNYGKFGKASNCDMPCGGNRAEMCGGHSANSVYAVGGGNTELPPPPTSSDGNLLGCYKDAVGDRDLAGYTFNEPGMTTQKCLAACQQRGFGYAATQYGQHCFCGNNYGKHGKATNCDMPCGGNKAEICGGHSANNVYKTGVARPVPTSKPISLTGAWVHSADGTTQTPDSKVIVLHEGNQVTLVATYKMEANRNQWQTYRCVGQLNGNELPVQCRWVDGGNPMSYGDANWTMTFQVTPDRDHLNYKHTKAGPGQDAYYSRVP